MKVRIHYDDTCECFLFLVNHEYGICFCLSGPVAKMHGITPNK
jgi:hypothetical protein